MKWCRYQLVSIIYLDLISYNFILFMYDFLRIAYMYTMCFDQNPHPQCLPPTLLRSLIPYFPPNFIPLFKKKWEACSFLKINGEGLNLEKRKSGSRGGGGTSVEMNV